MQLKSWHGLKTLEGRQGSVALYSLHQGSSWPVRGERHQSEEENVQAQQKKGVPLGHPGVGTMQSKDRAKTWTYVVEWNHPFPVIVIGIPLKPDFI